jgi:hypothetical protein
MTEKREKPLGLDMPFNEALERFIGTKPSELPDRAKLKQKRGPPKRPPRVKRTTDHPDGS